MIDTNFLPEDPSAGVQDTQQVILLQGLPGAGKSYAARAMQREHPGRYKRINKDDLRTMLDNGVWGGENEKFILTVRDALICSALTEGYSVIVDDTNLHPKHFRRIQAMVLERFYDVQVVIRLINTPLDECIRRDAARPAPVGAQVIRTMAAQWHNSTTAQWA